MPTGVVFTTRSAAARASLRPGPSLQGRASGAVASPANSATNARRASGRRPATCTPASPRSIRPATTARALPPQPSTTARRLAPARPCSRRGARNPSPSVLVPHQPPSARRTRVFTAPSRRASGLSSVQREATACLWGRVMLRPRQSSASRARTTPASSGAGAGRARYTQSRPSSSRAALCMAGESECRTGSPSTPTRAVVPEIAGRPDGATDMVTGGNGPPDRRPRLASGGSAGPQRFGNHPSPACRTAAEDDLSPHSSTLEVGTHGQGRRY
jgi:hypothetical protein